MNDCWMRDDVVEILQQMMRRPFVFDLRIRMPNQHVFVYRSNRFRDVAIVLLIRLSKMRIADGERVDDSARLIVRYIETIQLFEHRELCNARSLLRFERSIGEFAMCDEIEYRSLSDWSTPIE